MNFIVKNLLVLLSFLFFHSSSNLIDGEIIETKVSFSFFNAGKASMLVDNKIHFVNDLPCYKIDVKEDSMSKILHNKKMLFGSKRNVS